jgi:hypothetical protein
MSTYQKNNRKFLNHYDFMFVYNFDCLLNRKKQEIWRNNEDKEYCDEIEFFLRSKARGTWSRKLNKLFLANLDDAVWIKLNFSDKLTLIKRREK